MTPDELFSELEAGGLRSAYLLSGAEPLLRDDALARLQQTTLGGIDSDFDVDRLPADVSPAALGEALQTLPILAPRRLVLLVDPDARRGSKTLDALADLVAELPADASTVLVVTSQKADKRARWVKAFGKSLVDCAAPTRARELATFIRREAERQGVALGRGVAELLAERTGPQLLMLRNEIAKLALLAGEGESVSREHVAAGTPHLAEAPIWDLTDAIGEGRTGDAVTLLSQLLAAGAPGPVLLGSLVSHFRKLVRVGHGASVPGPPFVRKKLESQARRYGPARLRGSLDAIHQTDLALKGAGSLRPELALERLVIALAG
jgi:DNA polymerase-3 subunit delta